MARFLSYDPDGKSAWLHSGTTPSRSHWNRCDQPSATRTGNRARRTSRYPRCQLKHQVRHSRGGPREAAPPPDEDGYEYHFEHPEPPAASPTSTIALAPEPIQLAPEGLTSNRQAPALPFNCHQQASRTSSRPPTSTNTSTTSTAPHTSRSLLWTTTETDTASHDKPGPEHQRTGDQGHHAPSDQAQHNNRPPDLQRQKHSHPASTIHHNHPIRNHLNQ